MKKTLFFVLLSVCLHAFSTNWVHVSSASDHVTYIDTDSIQINKENRMAWHMKTYHSSTDNILSLKALFKHDCKSKKYSVLSITEYSDHAGSNVLSTKKFNVEDSDYIIPGTVGEYAHNFVCSYKIPKKRK